MLNKSRYRFKVILCFVSLAFVTLVLLYLTGPRSVKGPTVRVLHVSYASHRIIDTSESPVVTIISEGSNRSVEIDREEWDLVYDLPQTFYQNNIILECTATFPIFWEYEGYGMPNVVEENVRRVENFNDTNTYSFVSLLNLMPLPEESTGKYFCSAVSETDSFQNSYVHLFVPGNHIFIIQNDLSIEADFTEQLLIPCPVSKPSVNVSLIFRGSNVKKDHIRSYDPEVGFILNAKFMEEQDALGTYYCLDDQQRRSGKIAISSRKDSMVKVEPSISTVRFDEKFDGMFKCQAKENVTLKFRRVNKFRKALQTLNSSSNYPFLASVNLKRSDLKDGSIITCQTVSQNIELHSWKVILSESQEIQSSKFYYKMETDEYVCCATASYRPKLLKIDCLSYGECLIKKNCWHSQLCDSKGSKALEKSGCLYHKIDYDQNISSGLFQCGVDDKFEFYSYFNLRNQSGFASSDYSNYGLQVGINISSNSILQMEQVFIRKYSSGLRIKYKCKGPKYYFASGLIWQIIRFNGLVDFFVGNEYFDGPWIHSHVEFDDPFDDQRQIKKIYCFAPIWNSPSEWKFVSEYIT